jgi:hypothetical protein
MSGGGLVLTSLPSAPIAHILHVLAHHLKVENSFDDFSLVLVLSDEHKKKRGQVTSYEHVVIPNSDRLGDVVFKLETIRSNCLNQDRMEICFLIRQVNRVGCTVDQLRTITSSKLSILFHTLYDDAIHRRIGKVPPEAASWFAANALSHELLSQKLERGLHATSAKHSDGKPLDVSVIPSREFTKADLSAWVCSEKQITSDLFTQSRALFHSILEKESAREPLQPRGSRRRSITPSDSFMTPNDLNSLSSSLRNIERMIIHEIWKQYRFGEVSYFSLLTTTESGVALTLGIMKEGIGFFWRDDDGFLTLRVRMILFDCAETFPILFSHVCLSAGFLLLRCDPVVLCLLNRNCGHPRDIF